MKPSTRKHAQTVTACDVSGAGLAVLALLAPPSLSPRQMVAAQIVRGDPIESSITSNAPPPGAIAPSTSAVGNIATNPPTAPTVEPKDEYLTVGFDKLSSFRFEVTDSTADDAGDPLAASLKTAQQIPISIKALNEREVSVTGFMLPIKVEKGAVTEFLLLKNQSACCYGAVPRINEWITVRMAGKGVKPIMDQTITASGTLHVGEVRENGYLVGIYRMDADQVRGPRD